MKLNSFNLIHLILVFILNSVVVLWQCIKESYSDCWCGCTETRDKCYVRQTAWAERSESEAEPSPDPMPCAMKGKRPFSKLSDLLGVY